ncbi:aminodeoxychorismate synthase component I [Halomonas sp. GD1P12]|uniref:aminodeoxychorismate synthase component I n=1 Tax=Halomonas sp. GD1P12 TaxID=2982691 RepID=UPI0021E395ED|nr:aminodeoxychorismate synthase component I [Halomonas sp. GD1P12]UYG01081.1 aminodeoxychorismate synthase component I [Halomonas sp. GD1P12]
MSASFTITALPYAQDPLALFARLKHRPGAILLDSGRPAAKSGRFDILVSDPIATLEIDARGAVALDTDTLVPPRALLDDPFALKAWLLAQLPPPVEKSELPFMGGLMGYWSYEFGLAQQGIESRHESATSLPAARLGLYDWCITLDHHAGQAWLVASPARRDTVLAWLDAPAPEPDDFRLTGAFEAELDQRAYVERFEAVQRYIRAGDCYQINLAQRLSAPFEGDAWQAYQRLRRATPTPFSAFMTWKDQAVLSLSPERFIQVASGEVETRPIKGTRARGKTPAEDQALAEALLASVKDRAENVMIVDLLRNDLGRVCRPGSIHVPKLCALESYPNVHHLVSVVQGTLAEDQSALSLLAAAFPGGSITGAPKFRAMQIIDELEPCQRSVYCGSLGYVDVRGHMDTSIAIRTMVADQGALHVWGGGGLVADSQAQEEYTETLDKICHLIGALE